MFGRYALLSQVGVSPAGVRYRAVDPTSGAEVELWALRTPDGDAPPVEERTRRIRAAALLAHPSARRVVELGLGNDPPFVVLECLSGRPMAESPPFSRGPIPWDTSVVAGLALAGGLAEAHRIGLIHGELGPRTIAVEGPASLKVDWSGLAVEAASPSSNGKPAPPADVSALGRLIAWWVSGGPWDGPRAAEATLDGPADFVRLVSEMLAADPADRPTARQVERRLRALHDVSVVTLASATLAEDPGMTLLRETQGDVPLVAPGERISPGDRLGRFLIREKLGEGGMGEVYRGEDLVDGSTVAIKVLRESWTQRPDAVRRFTKEARLLAEVNNPFVTRLVELNEDAGVHYIALEYVAGISLAELVARRGRLDEPTALAIMADVARGLSAAHERGIVHRDVKPENVLLIETGPDEGGGAEGPPRAKLSDFGLARHQVESESLNVTKAGAILGTPLYMAPEQCAGEGALSPASDVYSMGATLFHTLAGRAPFVGASPLSVIAMHQNDPPPVLRDLNESASEAVGQVIAKALAKRPESRYADADEMLQDLDRLLRGEPTGLVLHPRIPQADPRKISRFEFRLELDASPRQLWPHVSNTERFNRAIGLPAVAFSAEPDPEGGIRRFGHFRKAGVASTWREHPFEWIEGRRMGVFREFTEGPFQWFVSIVELTPRAGGGTTLTHTVRLASHGAFGRAVAAVEIGIRGRRSIEQVYRRIDAVLTGKLGRDATLDPFEAPPELPRDRRERLERWVESLGEDGIDPLVAGRVGDFLARAPAQDVTRIRPLALARRLGLDAEQVVSACLLGARDGTLILLWDLVCPICRIPSQVIDTLRALREHGHCEACRLDFGLDFANSVELIFRVHPEVRETELGVFCIGGPAHSPHVAAQARVGPGERLEVDLALAEGAYRIRGPQMAFAFDFRVASEASAARIDLDLGQGPRPDLPRALRPGAQTLVLANPSDRELLVRVERIAARDDALTAARASAMSLFRSLFPGEVLSPGQLINLATVTLLVTDLADVNRLYEQLGDSAAFAKLHEQFRILDECVKRHGGALVKTVNEGIVSAFSESASAVEAALAMGPALDDGEQTRDLALRVGVHRGPAMVATINDHLDYFGTMVNVAAHLPRLAGDGGIVVTPAVAADTRVAEALRAREISADVLPAPLSGLEEGFVHLLNGRSR